MRCQGNGSRSARARAATSIAISSFPRPAARFRPSCLLARHAILGPKRLGYAAGISCHGTQMLDYLHEIEDVSEPVCILWGDRDHRAPEEVLSAYRALAARKTNVELHIFPGVQHGYMMQGMPKAYDARAREFSMRRAMAVVDGLRSSNVRKAIREAS